MPTTQPLNCAKRFCGGSGLAAVILAISGLAPVTHAADTFTHTAHEGYANKEVRFTVTPDGLSSVRVGGKQVAEGEWVMRDASKAYPHLNGESVDEPIQSKRLEKLGEKKVRVTHRRPHRTTIFTYRFDGEDVTITARVENDGPKPYHGAGFTGLKFRFGSKTNGWTSGRGWGRLARLNKRGRGFHPSWDSMLGGGYRHDQHFGVGWSPHYRKLTRTIWMFTKRGLTYVVDQPVPPRGARTYEMALRVSANTDWRHLLTPYKQHFRQTFGEPRYNADHRPVGVFVAAGRGRESKENPDGFRAWFKEGNDRGGLKGFAEQTVRRLGRAHGQGVIIWNLTGQHPTGWDYDPNFDIFPKRIEKQIPAMHRVLNENGIEMGAFIRPSDILVRSSRKWHNVIRLYPESPHHKHSQLKFQWGRIKDLREMGFGMFYMDVFGSQYHDIRAMQYFSKKLGPDVLAFSEHWTDVTAVYAPGFMTMKWRKKAGRYDNGFPPKEDDLWRIIHWMMPGAQAGVRMSKVRPGNRPDDAPDPLTWALERHMTPMIKMAGDSGEHFADRLNKLVPHYLDEDGQWKHPPVCAQEGAKTE